MHPKELERTATPTRETIAPAARAIIDAYLALPIGAKPSCPYFNNRRRRSRSQLRVLKGKGSPAEIAEEAEICAKLAHVDIASLSTDKLKEFLIREDLGIDCSGFAYHVLDALSRARNRRVLAAGIAPIRRGFMGKLAARLRPAENTGVATFSDERNSFEVALSSVQPGDFIAFLGTGKDKLYNHMIVVTAVERIPEAGEAAGAETSAPDAIRLSYAHSYAWPSDGTTGHGVREGEILVRPTAEAPAARDLLAGTWKESGRTGPENYTLESALSAKSVSLRRLAAFRD